MSGLRILFGLVALTAIALGGAARADSWLPPRQAIYYSAHRSARLIVTPHIPPRGAGPRSGRAAGPSAPDAARAILQHRDARGTWAVRWRGRLLNDVAPVGAAVADSAAYFATFDDWGSMGTGPHVVVIYDGEGRTIRALSILDLLPRDYVEALMRTVGSIWWSDGRHRMSDDGRQLLLSVGLRSMSEPSFPGRGFELAVDLATGRIASRGDPASNRAMAAAAASRAAADRRRAARTEFLSQPLVAPRTASPEEWGAYLDEAFKRLAPDWDRNNATNLILGVSTATLTWRSSSDPAHVLSTHPALEIMIAAPTGLSIAAALAPVVAARPAGWLHGIRLYIVANDATWPEVQHVLAPTGATLFRVDPARPIPQRPERLPDPAALTQPS